MTVVMDLGMPQLTGKCPTGNGTHPPSGFQTYNQVSNFPPTVQSSLESGLSRGNDDQMVEGKGRKRWWGFRALDD